MPKDAGITPPTGATGMVGQGVLRECLIAYLVLLAFMFGGRGFLALLGLSELALSIAGGVILFARNFEPQQISCKCPSRPKPVTSVIA